MNLLLTGRGTSGSFRIRGEQLAKQMGATCVKLAVDFEPFDAVVIIKRALPEMAAAVRRSGVPLIWDVVDAWPQPDGNRWGRDECMSWLRSQIKILRPDAIVATTKAMAYDCAEFDLPTLTLPHHARPGLEQNPIRPEVKTVGYEGGENYIAGWHRHIVKECHRRGWAFVINPPRLADVDIVLGLRDVDGYAPRRWKSNVKLANAQGSGTPFVGVREAGYIETGIGTCEKWADTPEELSRAFDDLSPLEERQRVSRWMMSVAPRLPAVADRYRTWLEKMCETALRS